MQIIIRSIKPADKDAWQKLWRGYQRFYKVDLSDGEEALFMRLVEPQSDGPFGFVAEDGAGRLVGLVHFLFHASTWSEKKRCYLNDLFTDENARGAGIGKKLIETVYEAADKVDAERVYWLTQDFNAPARALYDKVAEVTPFIKYQR